MSFKNKVVLVTGASSGIGAATAITFAKDGANVVLVGRNEQKLQKVKEECSKTGNVPLVVTADICDDDDAKRVIRETIDKFGKINVLVNNAGKIGFDSILSEHLMSQFDSIMRTNLRAAVYITYLAVPYLIKTKGNIVNISSVAGKRTSKMRPMVSYASSKAALDHFTRNIAAELASYGVRVNLISPGPVKTDILVNAGISSSGMQDIGNLMPLERVSESEEIADLVLYLASDKAKAITGSDYITDNGAMLL